MPEQAPDLMLHQRIGDRCPEPSDRFIISETIYGRDAELQLLQNAYQRAMLGGLEMVFVAGPPGIGKSYLIHEFQTTLQGSGAIFVSGKFDQFKHDTPYQAILQADRQLVQYMLSLPEAEGQRKKRQILDAVGPNGQVLIELNPDWESVIGPQPPLPELPPTEKYNRFVSTLQRYISVFTSKDHPLILFMDDMQWADAASIQLVSDFALGSAGTHIMFIGAYRDQEHTESHPFRQMREKLQRAATIHIVQMMLQPLEEKQIDRLLSDTLHATKQPTSQLAGLIMHKTKGNPFFAKQFFRSLHDLQLLRFDYVDFCWEWDCDQINELHMTDNVVDFMINIIRRLPEPMQLLLMHAACIGHEFTADTLALVTSETYDEVCISLSKAADDGLVLRIAPVLSSAGSSTTRYKFLHDRVYQALYSLVPEQRKKKIHLKIGRLLLSQVSKEAQEDRLFHIANQLNLGAERMDSEQEKERLLQLNMAASRRAKANSAYDTAHHYAAHAMSMLSKSNGWTDNYGTAFEVHMLRAELEYLCGHFDEAKRMFDTLLLQARTKLEKADTYNLMMVLYTNMGQHEEALHMGLEGLRLFGIPVSSSVGTAHMMWEMLKTSLYMGPKQPEDLLDIPVMTDPNHKAVMQLFVNLIPPAYFVNPELYIYLMLRMFRFSLRYGLTEGSAYAISVYGVIVSSIFGRLKAGKEYGLIGLKLSDTFNHLPTKSKVYFGYGGFTNNVSGHIASNVGCLKKAYQYGIESGDFVYAGYSIAFRFFLRLFQGDPLAAVLNEADEYHTFIYKAQDKDTIWIYSVLQRYIVFMREVPSSSNPSTTPGEEYFLTDAEIGQLQSLSNKVAVHTYYALQAQSFYILNRKSEAKNICDAAEAGIRSVFGFPHVHLHYFHRGMVLAGLYEEASPAEKRRYQSLIRKSLRFLVKWSRHSPDNFLHLKLLLEAEWYRISGKPLAAAEKYDQAIQGAAKQKFVQYEAIACECAANFYMEAGQAKAAETYLAGARALYVRWGAARKVAEMDARYRFLTSSPEPVGLLD